MLDLSATLPRDLLLDLHGMTIERAQQAYDIIDKNTDLTGSEKRGTEGLLRYRMTEQGFKKICTAHAGLEIGGALTVAGTTERIYQPFMRFVGQKGQPNIILGMASMPVKGELPNQNKSREIGVQLNYHVTPRLALDAHDPQPGDIFVVFLTARDLGKPGKIEEVAVGIIESDYQSYAFYEPIEAFMARYAPPAKEPDAVAKPLVKLKKQARTNDKGAAC